MPAYFNPRISTYFDFRKWISTVSNPLNLLIKILVEKSMKQSASNSNFKAHQHTQNCLLVQTEFTLNQTIPSNWTDSNTETSMRIRLSEIQNYQATKDIGIYVARAKRLWPVYVLPVYAGILWYTQVNAGIAFMCQCVMLCVSVVMAQWAAIACVCKYCMIV